MNVHPKTSGAALGAALGIVIVGTLQSVPGVHLAAQLPDAIVAFLSLLGSYLAPGDTTPSTVTDVTSNKRVQELNAREQSIAAREEAVTRAQS